MRPAKLAACPVCQSDDVCVLVDASLRYRGFCLACRHAGPAMNSVAAARQTWNAQERGQGTAIDRREKQAGAA